MYFATVVCPTSIPSESFYTLREAQIRPHASLGYSAIQSSCVAVFLFDQLVRAQQDRCRHIEAKRLGGRHIEHGLVFHRQLHRQIGRLLALKDAVDVGGGAASMAYLVRPIRKSFIARCYTTRSLPDNGNHLSRCRLTRGMRPLRGAQVWNVGSVLARLQIRRCVASGPHCWAMWIGLTESRGAGGTDQAAG